MPNTMPQVPPRPNKIQPLDQNKSCDRFPGLEVPKIPPRPVNRRPERSASPLQSYTQSPLNISPANQDSIRLGPVYAGESTNASAECINRPPSVNLPSLGQEGIEYADVYEKKEDDAHESTPQIRNIDKDLKLYAPKPSLSDSNAMESVLGVTRTDSSQAATFGLGKANPNNQTDSNYRSVYSAASDNCASSISSDHGIPQIGQTVPMYPNAGDVQAPSPALSASATTVGTSVSTDGSKSRHHGRKPSGRDYDIPADAYGRYGHGMISQDRFDKAYYKKHPELLKKELGSYGENRSEWALSSDDLNKIVHDTACRGTGVGVSPENFGTPSEQIGFKASEEYASRISSPRPTRSDHMTNSNSSESTGVLSRKTKYFDDFIETKPTISSQIQFSSSGSEDQDHVNIIHVDNPLKSVANAHRDFRSRVPIEALGSSVDQETLNDNHGYGAPILASDEVAKDPHDRELEPAISPLNENTSTFDDSSKILTEFEDTKAVSYLKSSPAFTSPPRTPLEDVNEYEPLFPVEEKIDSNKTEPLDLSKKMERLESKNRKFPSRDVWEDTPHSLQYTATVTTHQLPEGEKEQSKLESNFETPAQAFARRHEELAEQELKGVEIVPQIKTKKTKLTKDEKTITIAKPKISNPRFPSRDIWEDVPDSLLLQTTVEAPQIDVETTTLMEGLESSKAAPGQNFGAQSSPYGNDGCHDDATAVPIVKPDTPGLPITSMSSDLQEQSEKVGLRQTTTPKLFTTDDASISISSKTKPQLPVRPSKNISREPSETLVSVGSTKAKPIVPSRPAGNKIAALQAGFMSDLSKRLQLGPQAPKKEVAPEVLENEVEKAPLVDARKGRARGPVRRAPRKPPVTSAGPIQDSATTWDNQSLGCIVALTIWSIDPDVGNLRVSSEDLDTKFLTHSVETPNAFISEKAPELPNSNPSNMGLGEVVNNNAVNLNPSNQKIPGS